MYTQSENKDESAGTSAGFKRQFKQEVIRELTSIRKRRTAQIWWTIVIPMITIFSFSIPSYPLVSTQRCLVHGLENGLLTPQAALDYSDFVSGLMLTKMLFLVGIILATAAFIAYSMHRKFLRPDNVDRSLMVHFINHELDQAAPSGKLTPTWWNRFYKVPDGVRQQVENVLAFYGFYRTDRQCFDYWTPLHFGLILVFLAATGVLLFSEAAGYTPHTMGSPECLAEYILRSRTLAFAGIGGWLSFNMINLTTAILQRHHDRASILLAAIEEDVT